MLFSKNSIFISLIVLLIGILPSAQAALNFGQSAKNSTQMVYFSNHLTAQSLAPYNLIVLDQEDKELVPSLIDDGKTVLAYFSLNDVDQNRDWFKSIGSEGLIKSGSQNLSGNFLVDIRDPRWTSHVIENLIPTILKYEFNGLFLDAFSQPATLEQLNPKKNKGMTKAVVQLVLAIRRHYPEIKIMINHSYDLLPHIGEAVDFVLAESVSSNHGFSAQNFDSAKAEFLVESELYLQKDKFLQQIKNIFPHLKIYQLRGVAKNEQIGAARIFKQKGKLKFVPLVSTGVVMSRNQHLQVNKKGE